jgi:AmiR/NasT family two-component response regulator
MPCNALIVVRKPELAEQIRAILAPRGYTVSDACTSGAQGLRFAATHAVDIAIIGYALPDMTGLDFAMSLLDKSECSALLLAPADLMEYIRQQADGLDIVALPQPATGQALLSALETMQHYRSRLRKASDEARRLQADLDRRALAEKAKMALMRGRGMSEAEAWRFLQKRAMDTGRTLREIAERVLEQYKRN